MKNLSRLLGIIPFLSAASLAIGFANASSRDSYLVIGYATSPKGVPCSVEVICSIAGDQLCRVSYPFGNIAYDKVNGVCTIALFKP